MYMYISLLSSSLNFYFMVGGSNTDGIQTNANRKIIIMNASIERIILAPNNVFRITLETLSKIPSVRARARERQLPAIKQSQPFTRRKCGNEEMKQQQQENEPWKNPKQLIRFIFFSGFVMFQALALPLWCAPQKWHIAQLDALLLDAELSWWWCFTGNFEKKEKKWYCVLPVYVEWCWVHGTRYMHLSHSPPLI